MLQKLLPTTAIVLSVLTVAVYVYKVARNQQPPPELVVPNADALVGHLRESRDRCAGLASIARGSLPPLVIADGANLYVEARAVHNGLVSRLILAATMSQSRLDEQEIETLLAHADGSAKAFLDWYNRRFSKPKPGMWGGGAEAWWDYFIEPAKLALEIAKLRNAEDEAKRARLVAESGSPRDLRALRRPLLAGERASAAGAQAGTLAHGP